MLDSTRRSDVRHVNRTDRDQPIEVEIASSPVCQTKFWALIQRAINLDAVTLGDSIAELANRPEHNLVRFMSRAP